MKNTDDQIYRHVDAQIWNNILVTIYPLLYSTVEETVQIQISDNVLNPVRNQNWSQVKFPLKTQLDIIPDIIPTRQI